MKNDNVSWILTCPCHDCNFKNHLKYASEDELQKALTKLPEYGNKTKIKVITAELRRRKRKQNKSEATEK